MSKDNITEPVNTWDNFYSFGAGWVMSEEAFMKKQNVIDYLKLKGSWGNSHGLQPQFRALHRVCSS